MGDGCKFQDDKELKYGIRDLAEKRLAAVVAQYRRSSARVTSILEDGGPDALSYYGFPAKHWRKIATTNSVERLNHDIRRRTRVVGIFPSVPSALRIITIRLIEETEDWSTERRYMDPDLLGSLLVEQPTTSSPKRTVNSHPSIDAAYRDVTILYSA